MLYSFQLLSDQEIIDMNEAAELWPVLSAKDASSNATRNFRVVPACPEVERIFAPQVGDLGLIGRGRRVMRFESPESSTTTHSMGDRIQRLETAVAEAHAEESDSTHPLLREGLLGIKCSTEPPRSSSDPTPAQLADTFGVLAVSASGTSRYFGPTAGPAALLSAQGSAGGDRAEFASPFADITESFPFDAGYSSSWDTALCLENLLSLPIAYHFVKSTDDLLYLPYLSFIVDLQLVLQRLRNKATSVYTEFRQPGIDGPPRPNPSELRMLGGSRAFLERSSVPRKPMSLPNTSVSMPTLIPALMPPASTPDPWKPQIPDSSYSSFAFDAFIGSARILSSTPADGLEAYLAAQMQSTSTNYPDAVPETDWAAFINSLE
ncbi:hypothetical protein B0H10DRAFT_2213144 [Mycena sp. CBHHK59/15]|nr:hypothetical protein B0H10DRAFT_2213144 [Mycena sp. CBHHK59/15]